MSRTRKDNPDGPLSDFWDDYCIKDGHSQPGNPHASSEKELRVKAHGLSQEKAHQILKDGKVRGHGLTSKQKRFMGLIAGGGHPSK